MKQQRWYGIVAEFEEADALVAAAEAARKAGYERFEAYSPYPIKALDEIVPGSNFVPLMVLGGGVFGGIAAYVMEYLIAAKLYPINVGGRPLDSWPAFIPITFELTVLFAAGAGFFGLLFLCGLPSLFHPLIQLPEFVRASDDRFFLCIEARDWRFDPLKTAKFFHDQDPAGVWEIEHP